MESKFTVEKYVNTIDTYKLEDFYFIKDLLLNNFNKKDKLYEYNSIQYNITEESIKQLIKDKAFTKSNKAYINNEIIIIDDNPIRVYSIKPMKFEEI